MFTACITNVSISTLTFWPGYDVHAHCSFNSARCMAPFFFHCLVHFEARKCWLLQMRFGRWKYALIYGSATLTLPLSKSVSATKSCVCCISLRLFLLKEVAPTPSVVLDLVFVIFLVFKRAKCRHIQWLSTFDPEVSSPLDKEVRWSIVERTGDREKHHYLPVQMFNFYHQEQVRA